MKIWISSSRWTHNTLFWILKFVEGNIFQITVFKYLIYNIGYQRLTQKHTSTSISLPFYLFIYFIYLLFLFVVNSNGGGSIISFPRRFIFLSFIILCFSWVLETHVLPKWAKSAFLSENIRLLTILINLKLFLVPAQSRSNR